MTAHVVDDVARARLDAQAESIERIEASVTRHRGTIGEIEKYLAEIKGPISWIMRFAGIIALAVLGVLGTLLWTAMLAHVR